MDGWDLLACTCARALFTAHCRAARLCSHWLCSHVAQWVCADCGYIYEPGTEPAFEELRQRWKCPQCAGPRRRFVKKAGGQYGALDDSPVLLGTAALALFTVLFVVVGLNL